MVGGSAAGSTLFEDEVDTVVTGGDMSGALDECQSDCARDDMNEAEASLADGWDAPPMELADEAGAEESGSSGRMARPGVGRRGGVVRGKQVFKGRQLSYLLLNAKTLTSGSKMASLWRLVKDDKMRFGRPPDLIGITEVGGASGSLDVLERLGPLWRYHYDVLYSLRSTSSDGQSAANTAGKVGGGIALLVHKRLDVAAREFKYDTGLGDDLWRLDGHVRVWRLDAKSGAGADRSSHRSMVITVAYVPPHSNNGWGQQEMRDALFGAIKQADKAICEIRRADDVFALTLAHLNAPDGGCPFDLFDLPWPPDKLRTMLSGVVASRTRRATLLMAQRAEQPTVTRPKCKSASAIYSAAQLKEGKRVTTDAARYGKVPGNGVMGALHPTSWSPCAVCRKAAGQAAVCNCGLASAECQCAQVAEELASCVCGKEQGLHGTHDVVLFPSQVVFQALSDPVGGRRLLQYRVQRVRWSHAIDHCITFGHVWVAPVDPVDEDDANASVPGQRRQPKRFRRCGVLRVDTSVAQKVAVESDELLLKSQTAEKVLGVTIAADVREEAIVNALGTVRLHAEAEAQIQLAVEDESLCALRRRKKQSAKACHRAQKEQYAVMGVWARLSDAEKRDGGNAATLVARKRKNVANLEVERALAKDKEVTSLLVAWRLSTSQTSAPKRMWAELKRLTADPGAPTEDTMKLLECLRGKDGKVISRSRSVIIRHLLEHRRKVFSIRSDLGQECLTRLGDAAVAVHEMNRSLVEADVPGLIHRESAAARVAHDPLHMARGDGVRLEQQQRAIREAVGRRAEVSHPPLSSYAGVNRSHKADCDALQRPFTVIEVEAAMTKMRDVGAGSDGVAPVLLCAHTVCTCARCVDAEDAVLRPGAVGAGALGPECATAVEVCRLFNQVWDSARIVDRWREHRLLLHYKGKGEDPHCVDSYRGLGIDQALLKLLSLTMLERLDAFVSATGALSLAQGGFQRQRGTPEQAFTLSEVVRAAARRSHVHIAFIDIERAYDSVLHPLLWKTCIDKGIGGRFLAVMQDVYEDAVAVLDVGGVLLDAVPLECGVLQGNPLSPILFNMFIDGCIRELEAAGEAEAARLAPDGRAWGLPLPRVSGRNSTKSINRESKIQADLLAALFYADDGALMETRLEVLQCMLSVLASSLARIGLRINVRKTKWLMVCQASCLEDAFLKHREGVKISQPLLLGGAPIELVDKFDYLGVSVNWRWNWDAAWRAAVRRGFGVYHAALRGGWHKRAGSLESQMVYARSSILCHLTYVAALTGAGGSAATASWRRGEKLVASVLRTVTDCRFADAEALAVESGTWDLQTRIDMLLLRFWCKISVAPVESTVYRALCLSVREFDALDPGLKEKPETANGSEDMVHRQPWAQQLVAAAGRFGMPVQEVRQLCPSSLVRLQAAGADGVWVSLPYPVADAAVPLAGGFVAGPVRFRWVRTDALGGRELKEHEHWWALPVGTTQSVAFFSWSGALRSGCHASLKRRGNARRQSLVGKFIGDQLERNAGGLKKWARLVSYSFQQPYWRVLDAFAARRLLRLRLDDGPYEDNVRRRPFYRTTSYPMLRRLPDSSTRVCYVCNPPGPGHPHAAVAPVHGRILTEAARRVAAPGVCVQACPPGLVTRHMRVAAAAVPGGGIYPPETLEHMLLECTCPGLVALREEARTFLSALALEPRTVDVVDAADRVYAPDFQDGTALLTVLLLGTAIGPVERSPALHPLFAEAVARSTSLWVRALTDDWQSRLRMPRFARAAFTAPGGALVNFVVGWSRRVFLCHRKELLYRHDYHARLRDPVDIAVPVSAVVRKPPPVYCADVHVVKKARAAPAPF